MFSCKGWKELRICHKLKNEIHIKVSLTALAWTSAWGLLNMPDRAHTSILKWHANYMSLHVNETCLHSKKINFFFLTQKTVTKQTMLQMSILSDGLSMATKWLLWENCFCFKLCKKPINTSFLMRLWSQIILIKKLSLFCKSCSYHVSKWSIISVICSLTVDLCLESA